VEIRRGNALGEGRGGRTLGWFLLPLIFLPGAFAVFSDLAMGSGSVFNDPTIFQGANGTAAPFVTEVLSVSSALWFAWIPVLVYSGLALNPIRSKVGWVLRRIGAALALFIILSILAAVAWYGLGTHDQGLVTATSNALFLVGVSALVAFLSFFTAFIGGTLLSLPVLVASLAVAALVARPLTQGRGALRAAPPRLASDHARLMVTVRLHGSKGHKDVEMIVDTGATNTNISPSLARDLGISGGRSSTTRVADGRRLLTSTALALIEYGPRRAQVPVQIGPVAEPLLGITTLKGLGLTVDPVAKTLKPSREPQEA